MLHVLELEMFFFYHCSGVNFINLAVEEMAVKLVHFLPTVCLWSTGFRSVEQNGWFQSSCGQKFSIRSTWKNNFRRTNIFLEFLSTLITTNLRLHEFTGHSIAPGLSKFHFISLNWPSPWSHGLWMIVIYNGENVHVEHALFMSQPVKRNWRFSSGSITIGREQWMAWMAT